MDIEFSHTNSQITRQSSITELEQLNTMRRVLRDKNKVSKSIDEELKVEDLDFSRDPSITYVYTDRNKKEQEQRQMEPKEVGFKKSALRQPNEEKKSEMTNVETFGSFNLSLEQEG